MKKLFFIISFLLIGGVCIAQDIIDLEQIVITPYRYEQRSNYSFGSLTVLEEDDFKNSNSKTVLDVLRNIQGIVVRDWYGNAAKAAIDIRGFGEQAAMNSVILIDGRRINGVDLSGVDFSQVPLNQVSKIEIIRGGVGAVLYGDNAVAGVVNIITKSGQGSPKVNLETKYGSYDTNSQELGLSGSYKELSYQLAFSRFGTHGHRNNSYFKAYDFFSKLKYSLSDDVDLRFSSGFHKADYGLPGNLTGADIENFGRTYSKYANDYAKDKDYYFNLGFDKDFASFGKFYFDISFRKRDSYSYFVGANAGWNPILRSYIETFSITPKYLLEGSLLKHENKLIAGIDIYKYDYSSDTYNLFNIVQDFNDINKKTYAFYFQNEFSILDNVKFISGYRRELARYDFDYHDDTGVYSDIDSESESYQKAYNLGLVYNYSDNSRIFYNLSRSFRFPATDEYFTWGSLNLDLKPQTSDNYEVGLVHRFNPKLQAELSLFRMDLKNELYYNPIGGPFGFGANENYDKTRRDGFEINFNLDPFDWLDVFASYSYIKARFIGDLYRGKIVPLVPRNKASLGFRFFISDKLKINLIANYIGEKYFINDQANSYDRIGAHHTLDANISYSKEDWQIMFGVSNICDREYSEYGVHSATTTAYNLYPSPGRNFVI